MEDFYIAVVLFVFTVAFLLVCWMCWHPFPVETSKTNVIEPKYEKVGTYAKKAVRKRPARAKTTKRIMAVKRKAAR